MTTIAFTGHRGLPRDTSDRVRRALRAVLAGRDRPLVGLSCLAEGADQLFAREVLRAGGDLDVVVPAAGYRESLTRAARAGYDDLVSLARHVHRMPFERPEPVAFMAASVFMLERADELFAVWDGLPARGFGGTADVVSHARRREMRVLVLWPPGSRRDG
ncbi:hypothetical protein [Microbispora bryophytorum]|uniref:hypothetical protein n=1 Tax=Microbispora bryophytorum TaxID=1460882 RepID=UPI0037245B0A